MHASHLLCTVEIRRWYAKILSGQNQWSWLKQTLWSRPDSESTEDGDFEETLDWRWQSGEFV